VVERLRRGSWRPVATVVTDEGGRAAVPVPVNRAPVDNRVRVTWPGDGVEGPVTVEKALPLLRRTSRLRLTGPRKFVDETRARLTVAWRARAPGTRSATDPRPVTNPRPSGEVEAWCA